MSESFDQTIQRARQLNQEGEFDDALEAYDSVINVIYALAEEKQAEAIDVYPDLYDFMLEMSPALLYAGLVDDVDDAYYWLLDKYEQQMDEKDPELLNFQHEYYYFLLQVGRYDEALDGFEELVPKRIEVLGKDNPDTLESRRMYAALLHLASRHSESDPMFLELIEDFKRVYGPFEPRIFELRNNYLNSPNLNLSRSEVIKLLEDLIEEQKLTFKALGIDNLDLLYPQVNLARKYFDEGRYDEAFDLCGHLIFEGRRLLPLGSQELLNFTAPLVQISSEIMRIRRS